MNDFDLDIFVDALGGKLMIDFSWMFDRLQSLKSVVSKLQPNIILKFNEWFT